MSNRKHLIALGMVLALCSGTTSAGPLDPDCTAEKAAKSVAAKATVGVGGRCSPAEAAADTAKDAAHIGDDDGILKRDDDKNKENKDKKKDKDKDKDTDRAWSSG
jgi:hypothetical protein